MKEPGEGFLVRYSRVVLIVLAFICSRVVATGAGDAVGRIERALTVGQVTKEENGGVAVLARDDNVPGFCFRLRRHGELLSAAD